MTMKTNNHYLATKMLTKSFMKYTKGLRKYVRFYDTYSKAFKDFFSALNILPNPRITHQIIDPVTLKIYLWVLSYDSKKTLPHYEPFFRPTYSHYAESLASFTYSADHFCRHVFWKLEQIYSRAYPYGNVTRFIYSFNRTTH